MKSTLACTPALPAADVPSIPDHELKVVVEIDAHTNICVVVDEFFLGHFAILNSTNLEGS